VSDLSSHALLTAALKSRAAGGAGSPSDKRPPEGLAERTAGDPTATGEPSRSFAGKGEAAGESPFDGRTATLVETGSVARIPDVMAEVAMAAPALVAVVDRSVVAWTLIHNW